MLRVSSHFQPNEHFHPSNSAKRVVGRATRGRLLVALVVFFLLFMSLAFCLRKVPTALAVTAKNEEETFFLPGCKCQRKQRKKQHNESSLCSDHATALGPGQRVVGVALYGHKPIDRYVEFLDVIAGNIAERLPGWRLRLYTNSEAWGSSDVARSKVCGQFCLADSVLDVCFMESLPSSKAINMHNYNVGNKNGMIWRWIPMLDPLVDAFISRDVDQEFVQRDADAVNDWITNPAYTELVYHSMHDNPSHNIPILGGMWGAKTALMRAKLPRHAELFKQLIFSNVVAAHGMDQIVLNRAMAGLAEPYLLNHDSYTCTHKYGTVRPFPTKRKENGEGVGWPVAWGTAKECPEICRPEAHKDWIAC